MPYKSKKQEAAYHATGGWKRPVRKRAKTKGKGRKK